MCEGHEDDEEPVVLFNSPAVSMAYPRLSAVIHIVKFVMEHSQPGCAMGRIIRPVELTDENALSPHDVEIVTSCVEDLVEMYLVCNYLDISELIALLGYSIVKIKKSIAGPGRMMGPAMYKTVFVDQGEKVPYEFIVHENAGMTKEISRAIGLEEYNAAVGAE
jgi:hypothetical protein